MDGVRLFRAPGRVNLIGEHTDYNDGFVLPVAIDLDTLVAIRPRNDSIISVYSVNRSERGEFDLEQPKEIERGNWVNYIEGTARRILKKGHSLVGADIALESDVPTGAGLSSSASLEIAVGIALLTISGEQVDRKELARAAQEGEHEYTGALIGIMDQLSSALGDENSALLIDCRSLDINYIWIDVTKHALMICNTGVKHDLATSAYNDRRRECAEATSIIGHYYPNVISLRDVTETQLMHVRDKMSPMLFRRARHVVTENHRTLAAAEALRNRNFDRLSELMYASHESLKLDYEVSAPELDLLVDTALTIPGVYGTRMTGGGFGGCTVSFVVRDRLLDFTERMKSIYKRETGRNLEIYQPEIVRGAEEVAERFMPVANE